MTALPLPFLLFPLLFFPGRACPPLLALASPSLPSQEELLSRGISLVQHIKPELLERIARSTGARVRAMAGGVSSGGGSWWQPGPETAAASLDRRVFDTLGIPTSNPPTNWSMDRSINPFYDLYHGYNLQAIWPKVVWSVPLPCHSLIACGTLSTNIAARCRKPQ